MQHRHALASLLSVVLLAGCSAGAEEGPAPDTVAAPPSPASESPTAGAASASPAATSPAPSSPAPTSPAPTSPAPTSPAPSVRTVSVAYAGGQVTGTDGREEVPVGEDVVLRISSDVAEEVHVHGYDIEKALPAGVPVDVPLTASIPGVFEVELHDSGKVLFQLRVS